MDYYSQFPAPSLIERTADVLRALHTKFSDLCAYENIVEKAVMETEPGSYSGWAVFGRRSAIQLASARLTLYKDGLVPKLSSNLFLIMAIVALQRRFRHKTWSKGGALYEKLHGKTLVGK